MNYFNKFILKKVWGFLLIKFNYFYTLYIIIHDKLFYINIIDNLGVLRIFDYYRFDTVNVKMNAWLLNGYT